MIGAIFKLFLYATGIALAFWLVIAALGEMLQIITDKIFLYIMLAEFGVPLLVAIVATSVKFIFDKKNGYYHYNEYDRTYSDFMSEIFWCIFIPVVIVSLGVLLILFV